MCVVGHHLSENAGSRREIRSKEQKGVNTMFKVYVQQRVETPHWLLEV